jgi:hypothetical protein
MLLQRLALNQSIFRVANERMQALAEQRHLPPDEPLSVLCECSHEACRKRLTIDRASYEDVRSDSRRFLVAVGHDMPRVERVLRECSDYAVVETIDEVAGVVTATDPRRSARGAVAKS